MRGARDGREPLGAWLWLLVCRAGPLLAGHGWVLGVATGLARFASQDLWRLLMNRLLGLSA